MTKPTPRLAALLIAAAATTASTAATWLTQIGGSGPEIVYDVTETHDRRICATGAFEAEATFGSGTRQATLAAVNGHDLFVACYDSDGRLHFATALGAARGDRPRAIAALPDGDVVVTGHASRTADSSNADLFLTRIGVDGAVRWTRALGGPGHDSGRAVAVTGDGAIFVTGTFENAIAAAADGLVRPLRSAGARDALIARFDTDGRVVWASRFGGTDDDEGAVIVADERGVLVGGTFREVASFGGQRVAAQGDQDVFLMALDGDGNPHWLRALGGEDSETVAGMVRDARGRIHLAGNFERRIELPGERALQSVGGSDVYLARFDANGRLQHAASFGGRLSDQVYAVARSRGDGLLLSGRFQGTADVDPGPGVASLIARSPTDEGGFLLRLDSRGEYVSASALEGAGMEIALGLAALSDGGTVVAGLFSEDLNVAHLPPLSNRGNTDVFLMRVPEAAPRGVTWGRIPDSVKLGW